MLYYPRHASINASDDFIQHPSVRRLNSLSKENIAKITEAYQKFTNKEGFSKSVEVKEIVDNDYNLNVPFYVMPIEERETTPNQITKLKQIFNIPFPPLGRASVHKEKRGEV